MVEIGIATHRSRRQQQRAASSAAFCAHDVAANAHRNEVYVAAAELTHIAHDRRQGGGDISVRLSRDTTVTHRRQFHRFVADDRCLDASVRPHDVAESWSFPVKASRSGVFIESRRSVRCGRVEVAYRRHQSLMPSRQAEPPRLTARVLLSSTRSIKSVSCAAWWR